MTSLLLPDTNVWVALHHQRHAHHRVTLDWFNALNEQNTLIFCRQTQLEFFRLLTTSAVMGRETLTQRQCWERYAQWLAGGRAIERSEPVGVREAFQSRTMAAEPAPKTWMDAYLSAFAETAQLTLVTFDKSLATKAKGALLLG
jgi:toxin-antitoxin system PIN domain toxin